MNKETIPLFSWATEGKAWIEPEVELEYDKFRKRISKIQYPHFIIICYQEDMIDLAVEKYCAQKFDQLLRCPIYQCSYKGTRIGFIQSMIGGPMAALIMERLIVRGGRYFLNMGTAGSLQDSDINPGDIVLCNKAIRNEGVSFHYLKPSKYCYPDNELLGKLRTTAIKNNIQYHEGPTITLDAPYRFAISMARKFRREGIITSDMEAAAIFAISRFRKVRAAAAFTISDIATKDFRWEPKFHSTELKEGMKKLFSLGIETLAIIGKEDDNS